jgi:hypothetical protein
MAVTTALGSWWWQRWPHSSWQRLRECGYFSTASLPGEVVLRGCPPIFSTEETKNLFIIIDGSLESLDIIRECLKEQLAFGTRRKSLCVLCPLRLQEDRVNTSVAEPEPQGAASFGRSRIRSRNAMRLRLRRLRFRQWY